MGGPRTAPRYGDGPSPALRAPSPEDGRTLRVLWRPHGERGNGNGSGKTETKRWSEEEYRCEGQVCQWSEHVLLAQR